MFRAQNEMGRSRIPRRVKTSVVVIAVVMMIAFSGCSNYSANYFPLPRTGQWTYDLRVTNSALRSESGSYICVVDGKQTIQGKRYTRIVNITKGITSAETTVGLYRRAHDGIYFRDASKPDDKESLLLPDSPVVGKSWTTVSGNVKRESRIESFETLEVSGRKYEQSLKISFTLTGPDGVFTGYEYRAPGVGHIRQLMLGDEFRGDWTLKDFRKCPVR